MRLDPLEPAHNVTMAIYLHYERGDVNGAVDLLLEGLKLDPQYQPALTRLGEIRLFAQGQVAEGTHWVSRRWRSIQPRRARGGR